MRRSATRVVAVVVAGALVSACAETAPVTIDAASDAAPDAADTAVPVGGQVLALDEEEAPRPQRSGTTPERTEIEVVPGPAGANDIVSSSTPGDVRQPPRTSSVVREAGAGPETSVEVEVGEVIASFAGRSTDGGTLLTLDEPILFDFDSAQLRPSADGALQEIAAVLAVYEDAPVEVVGHTDGRGSDAYNDELSRERAEAVVEALTGFGVDASRLTAAGAGSSEPVAEERTADGSDDPEGRAANRRVELLIVGVDPR